MTWRLELGDAIRNQMGMRYEVTEVKPPWHGSGSKRRYLLEASPNSRFWVTQETVDRAIAGEVWTVVFRSAPPTEDPSLAAAPESYLQSLQALQERVEHLEDAMVITRAELHNDGPSLTLDQVATSLEHALAQAQDKERQTKAALIEVTRRARAWLEAEGRGLLRRHRLREALEHLDTIQPGIGVG